MNIPADICGELAPGKKIGVGYLLCARALENMCYVCGVNRIGVDGNKLIYNGGSVVFSAKGEVLGFWSRMGKKVLKPFRSA